MRSSKSASWRPKWTSLTLTGAFKPLYSCCRLHYRWSWRQRHNKTSPIWSPEGDNSTAATASTHSHWLGAPSSGEERVGCGKCWPACVKLCASAVGDSEDSRVTTFQQCALPGCAAKTHAIGVYLSSSFQKRCSMNEAHFWFTVFSLFFLYFKYNYTHQIIYTGFLKHKFDKFLSTHVMLTRLYHSDLGSLWVQLQYISVFCHEMIHVSWFKIVLYHKARCRFFKINR